MGLFVEDATGADFRKWFVESGLKVRHTGVGTEATLLSRFLARYTLYRHVGRARVSSGRVLSC